MNVLAKAILILAMSFCFAQSLSAQCVPTTPLVGATVVCENNRAVYFLDYATINNGVVNFTITGGTILRSVTRAINPKESRAAIIVQWGSTNGNPRTLGQIQIRKSARGCSTIETVILLFKTKVLVINIRF